MMNRRDFVKMTCLTCVGIPLAPTIFSGCGSVHYVNGSLGTNGLSVLKSEFNLTKDPGSSQRLYVIVRNEKLEYPICLYRKTETEYSALLMKCTHQGTELQAAGDHLHCPAHGSEFDSTGKVSQGPAENNLRTFPVVIEKENLLIELK